MGRTNIVIDDELVKACMETTGFKTKKSLVDFALRELLRHEKQAELLQLKGKVAWEGDLSRMRKGRFV